MLGLWHAWSVNETASCQHDRNLRNKDAYFRSNGRSSSDPTTPGYSDLPGKSFAVTGILLVMSASVTACVAESFLELNGCSHPSHGTPVRCPCAFPLHQLRMGLSPFRMASVLCHSSLWLGGLPLTGQSLPVYSICKPESPTRSSRSQRMHI